jgi:4-alpha-glucanotransferase
MQIDFSWENSAQKYIDLYQDLMQEKLRLIIKEQSMEQNRASGIILHPTSLPGPDGIGDLGPEAYRWIDFLHRSGCQFWQVLPLGPTGYADSPINAFQHLLAIPI